MLLLKSGSMPVILVDYYEVFGSVWLHVHGLNSPNQ